jgi:uncharacterized protein YggE
MSQTISTLVAFFLLLFAYTKLVGPIPFSVTSVTTQKTDTFSVSAEGKASASPDIAVINVGVSSQGITVKQVQQELNTKMNAVSESIKKLGVEGKDIQTSNYSVYPNYDFQSAGQRITGYQANSNLTVKVRDIDKANSVIDAATANGANQVGGISFDVDDKSKAQNEAREKAVAEARRKATDAARIAGFKLGRVINYNESFGGEPRPIPMLEKAMGTPEDSVPTQVEPGTTEVRVEVTLSFQID